MSFKSSFKRTVFNVTYATKDMEFPDSVSADVAIFYPDVDWWDDDDLARTLITVITQELGQDVLLISWGPADYVTEVSYVSMERL